MPVERYKVGDRVQVTGNSWGMSYEIEWPVMGEVVEVRQLTPPSETTSFTYVLKINHPLLATAQWHYSEKNLRPVDCCRVCQVKVKFVNGRAEEHGSPEICYGSLLPPG